MAVKTSNDGDVKQYSVASSNGSMLGNISKAIKTSGGSNYTVSKTLTTTTSKVNGNRVVDNYRKRSYDDKFQEMVANSINQNTLIETKVQQAQEKYAGMYTPDEMIYVTKASDPDRISSEDYKSQTNVPNDSTANRDPIRTDTIKLDAITTQKDTSYYQLKASRVSKNLTEADIRSTEYKSSAIYGDNVAAYRNNNKIYGTGKSGDMDDGGFSNSMVSDGANNTKTGPLSMIRGSAGRYMNLKYKTGFSNSMDSKASIGEYFRSIYHSAGIWQPSEINLYKNFYRFGVMNPTLTLTGCKEFLFFTKTDLNIYTRDDSSGKPGAMNSYLAAQPFWTELAVRYPDVIKMLQKSLDNSGNPFNFLLSNMVQSNLDMPNVAAESIDTPANMYGVNYDYRGSSEASNDSFQFSLEFKDNKYLPVYHYFMAYDDYQSIKHHGYLQPWKKYIADKILYDHFSVYKILVDDDMETIIYYAKLYGVKPMSVPREAFSNTDFSNGLSYNVDFKAAFVRDMKPFIITDFNDISKDYFMSRPYEIDIHNVTLDRPDNRPAMAAYIETVPYETSYDGANKGAISAIYAPGGFVYKLRWRGDQRL